MGNIIQNVDLLDVLNFMERKSKIYQAICLQSVEEILGKDSEEYKQVRKVFLDSFNNYTRAVVQVVFGSDDIG
jgi:hypothetical protein